MTCRTPGKRTAPLLVAAIIALAAPAAWAAPAEQLIPTSAGAGDEGEVPVRVVSAESDPGFDWGDAGIGATGMAALAFMGGGIALATGYRMRRLTPS